jgi:hypothetical protein
MASYHSEKVLTYWFVVYYLLDVSQRLSTVRIVKEHFEISAQLKAPLGKPIHIDVGILILHKN